MDKTGEEIRDSWKIFVRYTRLYFWVDLITLLALSLNIEELELLSLIKIFKIRRLSQNLSYMNQTTAQKAMIRAFQKVVLMIMVIHLSVCVFY